MTSERPTRTAAFSLGSNLGDRERLLAGAVERLAAVLARPRVASLYRSPAVSPVAQPDYLNTALVGETDLQPEVLLALAKALEHAAGRRRGARFGPRPLDVDLVLWGDRELDLPELTLPHPRLRRRRFMLEPLAEVAPELEVPPDGARVADLAAALAAQPLVRLATGPAAELPPRRPMP